MEYPKKETGNPRSTTAFQISHPVLYILSGHFPDRFVLFCKLSSEVVEHQVLCRNAKIVEHLLNSFRHRTRTTHIVFNIFRSFVILQVSFVDYVVNESRSILHACSISSRVRTVECQMESEVREVLFDLQEIFQIEHLIQRTGTIEVRHLTISCMQCLSHVHDLRT